MVKSHLYNREHVFHSGFWKKKILNPTCNAFFTRYTATSPVVLRTLNKGWRVLPNVFLEFEIHVRF